MFFIAAVVASSLADLVRARTQQAELRRREADLTAELARLLLGAPTLEEALPAAGQRLAQALALRAAEIHLDAVEPDARQAVFPLADGDRRLGTLVVSLPLSDDGRNRLEHRVVPALAALLAAGRERERLQAEVLETQALRRSDEIKTAVLRSVSHDLRTPLTAIATAAEALAGPRLSAQDREQLAAAVTAEVARLTAARGQAAGSVEAAVGVRRPPHRLALGRGARRRRRGRAGPGSRRLPHLHPRRGAAHPRRRRAARARAGQPARERRPLFRRPNPCSCASVGWATGSMIRVVDRGPGLAYGEHERVFEPFYRGPSAGAGNTGSGLGLAIVRGFVEANGGRVWAESLPGQGTTFVVELPVQPVATPVEAQPT